MPSPEAQQLCGRYQPALLLASLAAALYLLHTSEQQHRLHLLTRLRRLHRSQLDAAAAKARQHSTAKVEAVAGAPAAPAAVAAADRRQAGMCPVPPEWAAGGRGPSLALLPGEALEEIEEEPSTDVDSALDSEDEVAAAESAPPPALPSALSGVAVPAAAFALAVAATWAC